LTESNFPSVWQGWTDLQTVLDASYHVHPERFIRQGAKPGAIPTEVWINGSLNTDEKTH
jgi:hypothetical protein